MDIECWSDEHYFYALVYALPALIIFGIIAPGVIMFYLIKKRKILMKSSMKFKFGFIYWGYTEKHFFWEFIILYRKVLLGFISVFMR